MSHLRESLKDSNGNLKPVRFSLYRSTMTRATETASIIVDQLEDGDLTSDVASCDLIREGAPIVPEPPIPKEYWSPSEHVRSSFMI